MVDYELIDKYIETARAAIESEKLESFEDIDRCLRQYNMIFKLNEETFDELIRRVLENVKVSLGDGVILEKNEKSNWFIETRVERGSKRFDAYEKYLEFVSGYPRKVITGIGNSMDKVMNNIGVDVTNEYTKGAEETLKLAKLFNVKKALLKAKSPSCGKGKIYDGTFSGVLTEGNGVTAKLLKDNGIEVISEQDL